MHDVLTGIISTCAGGNTPLCFTHLIVILSLSHYSSLLFPLLQRIWPSNNERIFVALHSTILRIPNAKKDAHVSCTVRTDWELIVAYRFAGANRMPKK